MFAAQRPRSLSKPIIFRLKSQSLPAAIRREPPAAVEQKMPPILSLSAGNAAISRFRTPPTHRALALVLQVWVDCLRKRLAGWPVYNIWQAASKGCAPILIRRAPRRFHNAHHLARYSVRHTNAHQESGV